MVRAGRKSGTLRPGSPRNIALSCRADIRVSLLRARSPTGRGMNRADLQRRLQLAEDMVRRLQENIAFQRETIAKLDEYGHNVKAASMFLRWLEAAHAKHLAERGRLFKELANS